MEKDGMKDIFDLVEEKLNGLDSITRREVLKKLLKSSAFLAILTGGGAGILAPALTGAGERKFISAGALTAPVPGRDFKLTRTHLSEGIEAAINEMMEEALREAMRDAAGIMEMGPIDVPTTDAGENCPGNNCGRNQCVGQSCLGNSCRPNECSAQRCPDNSCRPNDRCVQSCPGIGHTCTGRNTPRSWINPKDFLDRYGDQPFVRELKELFGNNVLQEIEGMILDSTSLRGRGLIDPGAPTSPSTRSLDDMLRDMPGRRIQQMPQQPVVQPPTTPPATTPPATTQPPATTPTPVGPRPTITPGTTPVAPTPITPRPIP